MMTIFLFKLRGGQNWVVARGQFWVDVSTSIRMFMKVDFSR